MTDKPAELLTGEDLKDPSISPHQLATIAQARFDLHAEILEHPNLYDGLRDWIYQANPEVKVGEQPEDDAVAEESVQAPAAETPKTEEPAAEESVTKESAPAEDELPEEELPELDEITEEGTVAEEPAEEPVAEPQAQETPQWQQPQQPQQQWTQAQQDQWQQQQWQQWQQQQQQWSQQQQWAQTQQGGWQQPQRPRRASRFNTSDWKTWLTLGIPVFAFLTGLSLAFPAGYAFETENVWFFGASATLSVLHLLLALASIGAGLLVFFADENKLFRLLALLVPTFFAAFGIGFAGMLLATSWVGVGLGTVWMIVWSILLTAATVMYGIVKFVKNEPVAQQSAAQN